MDRANANARFNTDDVFQRVVYAQHAMRLINNYPSEKGACTIAIDAPWGMGKSTFVHMWRNELIERNQILNPDPEDNVLYMGYENDPFHIPNLSFYYNAWENDFSEDAFLPLIYTICGSVELACESNKENESAKSSFRKLISATTGALSAIGCFAASGNALLAGQVGSVTNSFADHIFQCFSSGKPEAVQDSFKKRTAFMNSFREALTEFAAEYGKLFVFVDELDRCKPSFAVKTLEIIKFFFDVPNVVFVFSIDVEQLTHSIKGAYGNSIDGGTYLSKFFVYQLRLPAPTIGQLLSYVKPNASMPFETSQAVGRALNLCGITPREAVQVLTKAVELSRTYINGASLHYMPLWVVLLGMKQRHPDVYSAFFQEKATWIPAGWEEQDPALVGTLKEIRAVMHMRIAELSKTVADFVNAPVTADLGNFLKQLMEHAAPRQPLSTHLLSILEL